MLSYYLPDRELWKKIYMIVLPISLQSMLMVADATIDSLMLGQVSQEALASVSLAGQVQFIYGILMATFGSAFSIFVAQYWGKKDIRTVEKLLGMSLQAGLLLSGFFFLVTLFASRVVMLAFTSEQVFLVQGGTYLRWIAVSYFFLAITQSLSIVCRCSGFARQIFWISCATVPLDVIFNYIFIFGICGYLKWGVAGAAIATVIVRFLTCVMTWMEFRREGIFRVRLFYIIHFAQSLFHHIIRYCLPIFGNYVCYGVGIVTASIVMGHQEPDAVAANSLSRVIGNAACIFFTGLGSGSSIILGNLLGAGNSSLAKDTGRRLYVFSLLAGICSALLMVCALPFVEYFAKLTPRAVWLTRWMMVISIPSIIGKACNGFSFNAFNTGGDSRYSFKLDFFVVLCFMVPVSLIAAFVFHAPVLLLFFLVYMDEFVKSPIAFFHYLKYTWLRDLTVRKN